MFHYRKHHLLAVVLALALFACATASATVRHVNLPYANGSVNVYVDAGQCVIAVDGLLDRGSVKAIADGLRQLKPSECADRIMVLNSPGGIPSIAYGVADLVRKFDFDTEVASRGLCASACTYLFLGGRKRFVDDKSRIGVHQHLRDGVCSAVLTEGEEQRLRKLVDPAMSPANVNRLIEIILATDCKTMTFLAPEVLGDLTMTNAAQSKISKAIRNAMDTQDAQEIEKFRANASGAWSRTAGDRLVTVYTRAIAEPRADGKPAIWGLINHAADRAEWQSGEQYRSYEALHEADCEQQTLTVIRGFYTREPMGAGRIVWKTGRLAPTTVKPKTPAAIIYQQACGTAVSG